MKSSLLLGSLAYLLFIGSLILLDGRLLALALPILVYLAVGVLLKPREVRITAGRQIEGDHVSEGTPVTVHLVVTNEGPALDEVEIRDILPTRLRACGGICSVLAPLPAGGHIELEYTLDTVRGLHELKGVLATVRDTLGISGQQELLISPATLFVLPHVVRLRGLPIRPRRTLAYSGLIPARRGGPGVEFFGLRDYRPGDPLRWTHWRATARHPERFFSKEFEQECCTEVGLILDVRRQAYESADEQLLFEKAVEATAALAQALLNEGNQVGLLLFGSVPNWTAPGYGKVQRERILRSLAFATPGGFVDRLEFLPARLFPAHSQIVLISPLLRADLRMLALLRANGYQVLVVSPDPLSTYTGGGASPQATARPTQAQEAALRLARLERTLLLRRMQEADIQVLDWPVDQPLERFVHTRLGRRARMLTRLPGRMTR